MTEGTRAENINDIPQESPEMKGLRSGLEQITLEPAEAVEKIDIQTAEKVQEEFSAVVDSVNVRSDSPQTTELDSSPDTTKIVELNTADPMAGRTAASSQAAISNTSTDAAPHSDPKEMIAAAGVEDSAAIVDSLEDAEKAVLEAVQQSASESSGMENLYESAREAVDQNNQDKGALVDQLQEARSISETQAESLRELHDDLTSEQPDPVNIVDAAQDGISGAEKGSFPAGDADPTSSNPERVPADETDSSPDSSHLQSGHHYTVAGTYIDPESGEELVAVRNEWGVEQQTQDVKEDGGESAAPELSENPGDSETVPETEFENFSQKADQYQNILGTTLRSAHEVDSSVQRNLVGDETDQQEGSTTESGSEGSQSAREVNTAPSITGGSVVSTAVSAVDRLKDESDSGLTQSSGDGSSQQAASDSGSAGDEGSSEKQTPGELTTVTLSEFIAENRINELLEIEPGSIVIEEPIATEELEQETTGTTDQRSEEEWNEYYEDLIDDITVEIARIEAEISTWEGPESRQLRIPEILFSDDAPPSLTFQVVWLDKATAWDLLQNLKSELSQLESQGLEGFLEKFRNTDTDPETGTTGASLSPVSGG